MVVVLLNWLFAHTF